MLFDFYDSINRVLSGTRRAAAVAALYQRFYSTVTLLARLRGWSTSVPLITAVW